MLLLKTDVLSNDAPRREYQLKLDGYRAIAFKTGGNVQDLEIAECPFVNLPESRGGRWGKA